MQASAVFTTRLPEGRKGTFPLLLYILRDSVSKKAGSPTGFLQVMTICFLPDILPGPDRPVPAGEKIGANRRIRASGSHPTGWGYRTL